MEKHASGTRAWVITVVILVVAGVAAYFAGNFVERSASAKNAALNRQQIVLAHERIASLRSANQLLTANVWIYRAAVALDNRNFGVANKDVTKAVASLHGVDAASIGLDSAAIAALEKQATSAKVSVVATLQSQRTQRLRLASDISGASEKIAPVTSVGP